MLLTKLLAINPRFLLIATLTSVAIFLIYQFQLIDQYYPTRKLSGKPSGSSNDFADSHPISTLIKRGEEDWNRLLAEETQRVGDAAGAYRNRRGRHPPPFFDQWFNYAKTHNAVVVEEFFDPIYSDLNPFWALDPFELQRRAASSPHQIVVRGHETTSITDQPRPWVTAWEDLIKSIQEYLPDVIVPLNVMDESRLVVPWEDINEYMQKEQASRHILKPEDVVKTFTGLPAKLETDPPFDPEYHGGPYWDLATRGCPPSSSARTKTVSKIDFSAPPPELGNYLDRSYHGYVSNWTYSRDMCHRPELGVLHGNFIEPVSISTSTKLHALFGGSKLMTNNEILLPAAMYWEKNSIWSGEEEDGGPWEEKEDKLIWRGAATGGRNKDENWTGFHRHRFLSMVNGTSVHLAETGETPPNFNLPDYDLYRLPASPRLGDFLDDHVDAGFVHLICFPGQGGDPHCPYTDPFFAVTPGLPMTDQYRMKYLPDLDGNSFSGRYRGFLLSTSVPIKATLYSEWHDSRLVPWAHFVPMDSTFMDIYGILDYFIGSSSTSVGHDSAAKKIALDGKAWAERVTRREDMQIYVYRLLLEYARVLDEQRERLGFVEDLM